MSASTIPAGLDAPSPHPLVESAQHVGDMRLRIRLTDGAEREIDFGPYLRELDHPQFVDYMTPEGFAGFVVAGGNVMWGDYDLIFTIESLYTGDL